MKKDLLKKIAAKGYTISYAANLNFATYDIVKKTPGRIAFLTIVAGILGLGWPELRSVWVSVDVLIFGIANIYIRKFTTDVDSYKKRGVTNTDQGNRLNNLYLRVKVMDENADFSQVLAEYEAIEKEFNDGSEPDQIIFSNWYAHFKFFCEKDVSWMDEQLHFGLWRDKIPETAKVFIYLAILAVVVYYCVAVPELNAFFCKILYID